MGEGNNPDAPRAYLFAIPKREDVPPDRVVVHNSVRPIRRLGSRGFRAWFAPLDERVEVCYCGWASELGLHYRPHKEATDG